MARRGGGGVLGIRVARRIARFARWVSLVLHTTRTAERNSLMLQEQEICFLPTFHIAISIYYVYNCLAWSHFLVSLLLTSQ